MKDLTPLLSILFGAALVAFGGASVYHDLVTVPGWPVVEAEAMGTSIVSESAGTRRQPSGLRYGIAVTFTFPVGGRAVTAVGHADSPRYEYEWQAEIAASKRFPRASRHRIRYNPDDPREISMAAPDALRAWVGAAPSLAIGLIALGVGIAIARRPRQRPAGA
jgi:hypothetical protein